MLGCQLWSLLEYSYLSIKFKWAFKLASKLQTIQRDFSLSFFGGFQKFILLIHGNPCWFKSYYLEVDVFCLLGMDFFNFNKIPDKYYTNYNKKSLPSLVRKSSQSNTGQSIHGHITKYNKISFLDERMCNLDFIEWILDLEEYFNYWVICD